MLNPSVPQYPLSESASNHAGDIITHCLVSMKPYHFTGSSLVKDIEPDDVDIVVYDPTHDLVSILEGDRQWDTGGSIIAAGSSDFTSYKSISSIADTDAGLTTVNAILVHTEEAYIQFEQATEILKTAQLKLKPHRVELFKYMRNEIPMNPERFAKLSLGDTKGLDEVVDHGGYPWVKVGKAGVPF